LLLTICLFLTGCFGLNKSKDEDKKEENTNIEKISYSKLNEIVNNYSEHSNIDVIDVRSEELFDESHIKGAINVPYDNISDIIISLDREIIVYSSTSMKSRQAAQELIELGYKNVKYITGFDNWPYEVEKNR